MLADMAISMSLPAAHHMCDHTT